MIWFLNCLRDLEKLAKKNLTDFTTCKRQALQLGRKSPWHQHTLGADQLQSGSANKDLRGPGDNTVATSQPCALTAPWAAWRRAMPAGQERQDFSPQTAGVLGPALGHQYKRANPAQGREDDSGTVTGGWGSLRREGSQIFSTCMKQKGMKKRTYSSQCFLPTDQKTTGTS